MTSETPVFLTKVECPICKTINEFETIKVGAYTETDRDTDFCPKDVKWRNPRYQAYNPLLYFTATCTNCFYSREFNNRFKEWKSDAFFKTYRLKTVKERHLEMMASADSVIKAIGLELEPNRYPNETAILKLILAIIDETLNEKPMELDLGRFYLRVGWLFRAIESGENTNIQISRGHVIDVESGFNGLKRVLEEVSGNVAEIERAVAAQFSDDTISAELKSLLYQVKDKYSAELASFKEMSSLLEGKLDGLRMIIQEHRTITLGTDDDTHSGFHSHLSFHDFLNKLNQTWDIIPRNEKEALTLAVNHYVRAYEDGYDIAEGNQQIQASYLIAELSRRIGEYERAKEYFNKTIRTGQEFIHRYKGDKSRTALARKILELAIEQGRLNQSALKVG